MEVAGAHTHDYTLADGDVKFDVKNWDGPLFQVRWVLRHVSSCVDQPTYNCAIIVANLSLVRYPFSSHSQS